MKQMVGRYGTYLGGKFGATESDNLIGMELQLETCLACGVEQTARILNLKDILLGEDVEEAGFPFRCGNHLADHQVNIFRRAAFVLLGHGMCAKES